jgi:prepilin-type N-terminal cleavage/methylation domain-containing protein
MDMPGTKRFGFTLVEMLIVILVIGILIGLLLPAIQSARESARVAKCMNNQGELAKAIIQYDLAKKRLPGIFNPNSNWAPPNTPAAPFTTWVMAIFADMGRMDLWQDWSLGAGTPVKLGQLICPSDPMSDPTRLDSLTDGGGLSYVVNAGSYVSQTVSGGTVIDYTGRLFRNRAAWDGYITNIEPDFTIDSLKSPIRTVMLSESLHAGPWTYAPTATPVAGDPLNILQLAFEWPLKTATNLSGNPPTLIDGPPDASTCPGPYLSSGHKGVIVTTFCDGHTEKLPDSTQCWGDPDNNIIGVPSP